MSTSPEELSPGPNPFDLTALEPHDYQAAPQAIAAELLRIADLANDAVLLLRLPYAAHITGSEQERSLYDLHMAAYLEEVAGILSGPQQLEAILTDHTGVRAAERVFLNTFYNLSPLASRDELTAAIAERTHFMTTVRAVNEYGLTVAQYQALSEANNPSDDQLDEVTRGDREAFAHLLTLRQQYQAGVKRG